MALTTVKSIEQALSLVDEKKQSLKQAFEELQSHSSSLDFSWTDIDSYFSHAQSDLLDKFAALQALESSQTAQVKSENQKISKPVRVRPELKSLCEEMDALGLRKYVIGRPKERSAIRAELAEAFKLAPDAGAMVLDALQGFWDEKLGSGSRMRTVCVLLLEELMRAGVEIGAEVRERAKAVAVEWKAKMAESNSEGDEEGKEEQWGLERLGYLQLLASYKLLSDGEFDASELVDCVALSARYRQTVDLCRVLGLESRISGKFEQTCLVINLFFCIFILVYVIYSLLSVAFCLLGVIHLKISDYLWFLYVLSFNISMDSIMPDVAFRRFHLVYQRK